MKNFIPLKEFRQDVAKYAGRITKGETLIVTKRSLPLFRIVPVEEEGWETVIDFTKFRKGGIPASELLKILKSL
ncbi:MAG: hypothetical protein HW383_14 [Candidatus Magasanikbacteria bacterium]|nr:hypothetical protein [Candidatus Magasanikbacteria bacterium]